MNFAQDALWWRLTDGAVRDLASLLAAPPLWHSGVELPRRALIGETGFRFLLGLNDAPAPLHDYLAQVAPYGHRLGFYAESLLAFWFSHAPHFALVGQNLALYDDPVSRRQTLGSVDFLVRLEGEPLHLELTCKYYGNPEATLDGFVGLNQQDKMANKISKLQQQLAWSGHAAFAPITAAVWPEAPSVRSASIVRGVGFTPEGTLLSAPAPINRYGWAGHYLRDWAELPEALQGARWVLLTNMQRLSPARVAAAEAQPFSALADGVKEGVVAFLHQRIDGHWHETSRVMKALLP
ncbi:MAG: DUF1853 family protein [Neisseriaceae bacterium]|nr:DUF1853 family protein [Neisseriaceae bacterium]MBP6863298.1 DUF1853 family protein [Neisseriaceae bacterium]